MAENKMEQVAQIFGKKIGEEFKIKFVSLPWNRIHTVKFTRAGLECLNTYNEWEQINYFIPSMLTGKAVVVND